MAGADSNRIKMSLLEEVTFGETPGTKSQGTLTLDTNPTDADTMTIGSKTYTFETSLTNVDGNIFIGASLAATKLNIIAALTLTGTPGTDYALAMTLNQQATMLTFIGDASIVEAHTPGTVGDAIVTTETFTAVTNVFDAGTLGTTQAGLNDAVFEVLRLTSEGLKQDTESTVSQEIRSDRQTVDLVRNGISAAGELATEMSFAAYDTLLAAALLSPSITSEIIDINGATTISVDAADNSFNDSGSGFANYTAFSWIRVSGFGNSANNGYFKIGASPTSSKLIVTAGIVITEVAGAAIIMKQGGNIVNGVSFKTHTIEKEFTDLTNEFAYYRGMAVDQMSLNIAADAIMTGSFTFLGKRATSENFTQASGFTPGASNSVMNGIDNVNSITDVNVQLDATALEFTLINNLRARQQIGTLGAISLGTGTVGVTGSISQFYETKALMDKYLNFTDTSLSVVLVDASDNSYVFDFPRVKFSDGSRLAGGLNTDILAEMSFTAFREPTEDVTIRISKITA